MRWDQINAIELTNDLIGRPFEATVMFTEEQAEIADTTISINGERRQIEAGDVIAIRGTIMNVRSAQAYARGATIADVRVHAYNGEFREMRTHKFVWGSHISVSVGDPLLDEPDIEDEFDDVDENSSEFATAEDLDAMFGMPDPEDDIDMDSSESVTAEDLDAMFGMPDPELDNSFVCDGLSCVATPTRVGLLQADNPTPSNPEGIQIKVLVCDYHAMTLNGLWGTWTIENDSEYGVPVGAATQPIYAMEVQRAMGEISQAEFIKWFTTHVVVDLTERRERARSIAADATRDHLDGIISGLALADAYQRAAMTLKGVSLTKV